MPPARSVMTQIYDRLSLLMQPLEKSRIVQFLAQTHISDILRLHLDCPGIEPVLRHEL